MLVILVGATLEISKKSREHFVNRGFNLVEKKSYFSQDNINSARFGFPKSCTKAGPNTVENPPTKPIRSAANA